MSRELITQLVPSLIRIVNGLKLSREAVSTTLLQLAEEVRGGEHIPNEALERANEDQEALKGVFGK